MARRGFTLIELAVVLVIIGLLVGGVFAGRELMQAQSLRNTLQEAKMYSIAKQLFFDKYGALPGDMLTATTVWGRADGGVDPTLNCAAPETTVSVGKLTCNGDGDGVIEAVNSENFRAWQQLFAAEMIPGIFTGVHGAGGAMEAVRGVNVPSGALQGSVFAFESFGTQAGDTHYYAGNYENTLVLGGARSGGSPYAPILSGVEAQGMDEKIDDALPGQGAIRTFAKTWMDANIGRCVSADSAASATYIATSDRPQCILLFMNTFQAKPE